MSKDKTVKKGQAKFNRRYATKTTPSSCDGNKPVAACCSRLLLLSSALRWRNSCRRGAIYPVKVDDNIFERDDLAGIQSSQPPFIVYNRDG